MYCRKICSVTTSVLVFGLIAIGANTAWAQPVDSTDTQDYTVTVEEIFEVVAPFEVAETATYTTGDVVFSTQAWTVNSNYAGGADVTFSAPAFVNQSDVTIKRNVTLAVTENADPATVWGAPGADSTSDHATAAEASVVVTSTAAGNAEFDVEVTMDEGDVNTLAAGDYTTTVTGLLSAN